MPIKKALNYARKQSDETRHTLVWVITGICVAGIVVAWLLLLASGKFNLVNNVYKRNASSGIDTFKEGISVISETSSENIETLGNDIDAYRESKKNAEANGEVIVNTEI